MFAETLQLGRSRDPEMQSEYLATIVNECERLSRLVDGVLQFSKSEQGKRVYRFRPLHLSETVEAAARAMEYPLAQKGFELTIHAKRDLPPLRADHDALEHRAAAREAARRGGGADGVVDADPADAPAQRPPRERTGVSSSRGASPRGCWPRGWRRKKGARWARGGVPGEAEERERTGDADQVRDGRNSAAADGGRREARGDRVFDEFPRAPPQGRRRAGAGARPAGARGAAGPADRGDVRDARRREARRRT